MKRVLMLIAFLAVAAGAAVPTGAAASSPQSSPGKARFVAIPPRGITNSAIQAASTIPNFSSQIVSPLNGQTYPYTMVGKDPSVVQAKPTTKVTVNLVPVSFTFADSGHIFDPTAPDATCSPKGAPYSLVQASPLFNKHAYKAGAQKLGSTQFIDAFQRANFFSDVQSTNPAYHVLFTVKSLPTASVNVGTGAGFTYHGGCSSNLGELDINAWDSFVQNTLIPGLTTVTPKQFVLFVFSNVVLTNGVHGSCCIIGYHSAFSRAAGTQTYGIADYDTSQLFSNLSDVGAMSHEMGEWVDDPFVNNATPAWGHVGQVGGCQGNLEVGDPLSGTTPIAVTMPNTMTYHVQEMAFFSWFYRQAPSLGVNGWDSFAGTFTSGQPAICS